MTDNDDGLPRDDDAVQESPRDETPAVPGDGDELPFGPPSDEPAEPAALLDAADVETTGEWSAPEGGAAETTGEWSAPEDEAAETTGESPATADADGGPVVGDDPVVASDDDVERPLVLVIEDETPVANVLREHLEDRGCDVVVEADGQAGWDTFVARRPDLVVCDLLLPRRNGFRVIEDLARAAPSVPVVVVTGVYRGDAYREELAHARLFLGKPLEPEHLDEIAALATTAAARGGEEVGQAETGMEPVVPPRSREPWIPTQLLPLPRMLQILRRERRTGLLTHRCGARQTVFQLDQGRLAFVRCNDPDLRLGRVLRQLGSVTEEQLAAAERELEERTTPARLGEVLVEQGALTEADLHRPLQLQLRKVISAAFAEPSGELLFRSEEAPAPEHVVLDADPRAVIVAGCAAWTPAGDHLLGHLPDGSCLVRVTVDPQDPDLRLPRTVQQLLMAVREPMPLADVVAMADLVGLRGRSVVFGLLCADVLELALPESWARHVPARSAAARELPADGVPAWWLLDLEAAGATGTLRVRLEGRAAWLAMRDGEPCGAGAADQRSRLGHRLQDAGLVTPEQLELALRQQEQRPGVPLGRVLVEMGSLDPGQLLHAVRAQVLAVARDVASAPAWEEASFDEGVLPDVETLGLDVTTSDVVLDGLRAMPVAELEKLAGRLAAECSRLALDELRSERFSLSETEELVTGALGEDAEHVLGSLARQDASDPEVLRMAVLALLVSAEHDASTDGGEAMAGAGAEQAEITVLD